MNDQIIELTKSELREWLFKAWRKGRMISEIDYLEDEVDFEEWYEDGKWMIDE